MSGNPTPAPQMQLYFEQVAERLRQVSLTQMESIAEAGEAVAWAISGGGVWYVFGTGHSHILAEEAFYRAGGLVDVVPILETGLMLHESALQSSNLERLPGYAKVIFENRGIKAGDVILIASNSGRNPVPVEMARIARENDVVVIALTSLEHSKQVTSRDASGLRLFELADIVIDNGAPYGDALVEMGDHGKTMGATSTVTGAAIMHAIAIEAASRLASQGNAPASWVSANVTQTHEEALPVPPSHERGRYRHL